MAVRNNTVANPAQFQILAVSRKDQQMPSFKAEVPHNLGQEQAKSRLTRFADRLRETYQSQVKNLEETWVDDNTLNFSFSTFGFSIKGTVNVLADLVKLEGNLPFAAVMFKGKIEKEIHSQLEKILA